MHKTIKSIIARNGGTAALLRYRLRRAMFCVRLVAILYAWFAIGYVQTAFAQPPVKVDAAPVEALAPESISLETLQARRENIENNAALSDADKLAALEILASAIKSLQDEQSQIERLQALQATTDNIAAQLEATRAELESPTDEIQKPSSDVDLPTAQQRLAEFEENLRAAEGNRARLDEQESLRARRGSEVPVELPRARAELEALNTDPVVPADGLKPEVEAARASLRQAKRRQLTAKIALLERELPIYAATASLLSAKRSLAARKVTVARKVVETWREFVNRQRLSEAEANATEAAQIIAATSAAASDAASELSVLAAELVNVRSKLAQEIAATNKIIARTDERTARLKSEFDEIRARADAAGFTNSVGVLLRKHKSSLPDLRLLAQETMDRQVQIADIHIERLNYQNQQSVVVDVEELSEQETKRLGTLLPEDAKRELRNELRIIYQAKSRYLDGVIADLSSYLDRVATLDVAQRNLLKQSTEQSNYIAEHILWVRSTTTLDTETLTQSFRALANLRSDLMEVGSAVVQDIMDQRQLWLIATVILLSLLVARSRFRNEMCAAGKVAARNVTTELSPTLVALGFTAAIASIWPLVLLFIGWRLNSARTTATLSAASGYACQTTALLGFTFDFLRQMCRPNGLGVAHFQWPARAVDTVRQIVHLVIFVTVPVAGFALMMWRSQDELYQSSLGRLSLIFALMTLASFMHRALRPGSAIIEESIKLAPSGWIGRTRYVWYAMGVGIPVVLSCLAAMGYLYTAQQLSLRLAETGWLLFAIVVTACLLNRWQLVTYRTLAMKQARERRALLIQEQENLAASGDLDAALITEVRVETLSDSNVRLGKLFSAIFATAVVLGLGVIWNDVLPALGILSQFQLWESSVATEMVDGVARYEWITLREVSLAVLLLALTIFAATNIPALLEFAVLPRLPLDSGTRYAISTVMRYLITVFGVAFSVRMLGFGWANIQWLVAAMTVGLGFGLQEIFANFVSGLILLFERPIRIGDTVTVGDVTGTVARIRIRATTIVDWDRKELVVPNREFVTGQLVNWTLSDSVLRVIAFVGIAYGSDTRLATKLLYQVAADHPDILDDPPAKVVFRTFGASSLDFELRCFVSSPQQYRVISHDLNLAIDDLFRQHSIEIAFPQRDLHLRSVDPQISISTK